MIPEHRFPVDPSKVARVLLGSAWVSVCYRSLRLERFGREDEATEWASFHATGGERVVVRIAAILAYEVQP